MLMPEIAFGQLLMSIYAVLVDLLTIQQSFSSYLENTKYNDAKNARRI